VGQNDPHVVRVLENVAKPPGLAVRCVVQAA
jgi:hypothetical protein